ncbi:hypothetical protein A2372_04050 [Candidatus Wolfebacteria bacterium RIFOXYB1_FULL_54_12]|uniref:Uncharacterized protein n=1 Tax=Candidatus Wolfebacteria bacterium RIFOXYB1_FULL_54_12 TaxID=1802559 RepID=A0A1F8DX47_9BACT|nr:MAG: hypothetical protein A2372_04050 [Candidatus Wolfebacteria bacterium RIFOXYB1_FULL_54_12]
MAVKEDIFMKLLRCVGSIRVAPIEECLVGDEFVMGKNGIVYIDPSFRDITKNERVCAQSGTRLSRTVLRRAVPSRDIIAEIGCGEKAQTSYGDLLGALRSGKLSKQTRQVFFIAEYAIRVEWILNGWSIHAFSKDAPGEWSIGRQFIFRGPLCG